ncbi:MAG: glycogen synthase [Simkaniaceae bacterium]|nr:glycogen synthase [Candidatus Sacchlamyda saccharinae]
MFIVHVASELAPIAKVGGLGDVIGGLSKALVKKGHNVTVILPKYDCIDYRLVEELKVLERDFEGATLWSTSYHGVQLILIESHQKFFERGRIYGEEDDTDRFLFFCRVASAYLEGIHFDALHLHDWPTAACSLFYKGKAKKVFTIHNLEHQGKCLPEKLGGCAYNPENFQDRVFKEEINLMRGALYNANAVTVVSPTYMQEILTKDLGCDLEEDLKKNKKKLHGILNGIDTQYWDPKTDSFLVENYGLESRDLGKKANKEHLQKHLQLKVSDAPLVVAVTRLVPQKGPDLIHYGIEKTLELGGQFALLGSTDDPEMRAHFEEFSNHPNVSICFDYDEPLSHLLYAAADMFLMPSIFEPCGLAQMISLTYGTVPLVRATGGLKDTIFDGKNGFSFAIPDNKGVEEVLQRAFAAYQTEQWQSLTSTGMQTDLSWDSSATQFLKIYA